MRNRKTPHTEHDTVGHSLVQPGKDASRQAFTARLLQLVDEAGSKSGFAGLAGVTQRSVRLWIEGGEPGRDRLAAIAEKTGVSLDWLVAGRGPKYFSDVPRGYIAVRFVDFRKGAEIGALFSTDKYLLLPSYLFDLAEADFATHLEPRTIDGTKMNLMALLLPSETPDSELSDFVVFDLIKEGGSAPPEGTLCVILDDRNIRIRAARSSAGASDMFGPILGPVIFRGSIIRRASRRRASAAAISTA
jgi:hypothetical protein